MCCKKKNIVTLTATALLIVSLFIALCSSIGIVFFVLSGIYKMWINLVSHVGLEYEIEAKDQIVCAGPDIMIPAIAIMYRHLCSVHSFKSMFCIKITF